MPLPSLTRISRQEYKLTRPPKNFLPKPPILIYDLEGNHAFIDFLLVES